MTTDAIMDALTLIASAFCLAALFVVPELRQAQRDLFLALHVLDERKRP
jgi:hypothetical protein